MPIRAVIARHAVGTSPRLKTCRTKPDFVGLSPPLLSIGLSP
jgi:hypothetical protein